MTADEFMKLEYEALREEIVETQRRNFQTMGIGLLGIPAANYVAKSLENTTQLQGFVLAIPVLVVVIALRYLADNHNVIRCGRYINQHIESKVEGHMGWEEWLESRDACQPRTSERYLSLSVYLLFLLYYAGSVYVAQQFVYTVSRSHAAAWTAVGAYVVIGAWFGLHLSRELWVSTRSFPAAAEAAPPQPRQG